MSRFTISLAFDVTVSAARISLKTFDATRSLRTIIVALAIGPCLQIVYLIGMSGASGDDARIRVGVGAVLLSAAVASVESTAVVLSTSRRDGVLAPVVLSTLPAILVWLGQILAATLVGIVAGIVGLMFCALFFVGTITAFPILISIAAVIVVSLASAGFGFAIGSISLRLRDSLLPASIVVSVMFVLCGIVAPISTYWIAAQIPAYLIPLTSSLQSVDEYMAGNHIGAVALLGSSLLVGIAWTAIGAAAWRISDRLSRRSGSIELI